MAQFQSHIGYDSATNGKSYKPIRLAKFCFNPTLVTTQLLTPGSLTVHTVILSSFNPTLVTTQLLTKGGVFRVSGVLSKFQSHIGYDSATNQIYEFFHGDAINRFNPTLVTTQLLTSIIHPHHYNNGKFQSHIGYDSATNEYVKAWEKHDLISFNPTLVTTQLLTVPSVNITRQRNCKGILVNLFFQLKKMPGKPLATLANSLRIKEIKPTVQYFMSDPDKYLQINRVIARVLIIGTFFDLILSSFNVDLSP